MTNASPLGTKPVNNFSQNLDYIALISMIPQLKGFSTYPVWLEKLRTCAHLLGVQDHLDGDPVYFPHRTMASPQDFEMNRLKARACITFSISNDLLQSLSEFKITEKTTPFAVLEVLKQLASKPTASDSEIAAQSLMTLQPSRFSSEKACARRAMSFWSIMGPSGKEHIGRKISVIVDIRHRGFEDPHSLPILHMVIPDLEQVAQFQDKTAEFLRRLRLLAGED